MRVANYDVSFLKSVNLVHSSVEFAIWWMARHAHWSRAWVGWWMRQREAKRCNHQQEEESESSQQGSLHGLDLRIREWLVHGSSFTCRNSKEHWLVQWKKLNLPRYEAQSHG